MTLPNARSGVSKLFIAEILKLIGVLLLIIGIANYGAVVGIVEANPAAPTAAAETAMGGFAIGSIISLLGATILPIIALILTLVGLKQASKDEPDRMGKAFAFAVATLVLQICAALVLSLKWKLFGNILTDIATITELVTIIFTIMGVSEVTQMISRQDVADMGPKVITLSAIALGIALIASILGRYVGGIFAIVSLVLMLVAYVIFVVFLGRASGALKQA